MLKLSLLLSVLLVATPACAKDGEQSVSLLGSVYGRISQNIRANKEGIESISDAKMLDRFKKDPTRLVRLPQTNHVRVDSRLGHTWRWCSPPARAFLEDFGRDFHAQFGKPVQVNSAVRTHAYQKRLRRKNRNATVTHGPLASLHLRGIAVDVAKKPDKKWMSEKQMAWVRNYLRRLKLRGDIDVADERGQAVFHVVVWNQYAER